MKEFKALKNNVILKEKLNKRVSVSLLGDSATQFLSTAIIGEGVERGYGIDLFEAEYNQVERQILDPGSELYQNNSKYVVLFQSTNKLLEQYNNCSTEERANLASQRIDFLKIACERIKGKVICFNYPELDDDVFGSYSSKINNSFIYQVRKLNYEIMNLSQQYSNLFICDISTLQNSFGRDWLHDSSIYINTDMLISLKALPYIASRVLDIICAIEGQFKKCLIVDLDNTLWGGVVGDDGWENIQIGHGIGIGKAYTEIQEWIKKLKNRGIIVCVCSKNDEGKAKEAFEKNPEMVLKLEDISVFVANWNNKADNIRYIQKVLNIGFDSMVFLDDNAFERNIVRENIPDICVPELPDEPEKYLEFLYSLNLFETASFSANDKDRTKQYQEEAKRVESSLHFTNEADYLASLNMECKVDGFTSYNIPRVAQLSQRSNQFNLRTVRYTEDQIVSIESNGNKKGFAFSLRDKFGDNGLIAVIILHDCMCSSEVPENLTNRKGALFIDSWFMSCRVLKRGMEFFSLNTIVNWAIDNGYTEIIGEYLPTSKNKMVRDHYKELGFKTDQSLNNNQWRLDITTYAEKKCFITSV